MFLFTNALKQYSCVHTHAHMSTQITGHETPHFHFSFQVEDDLEKVKNASSQSELLDNFRLFGKNTSDLINQAAKRQNELKDPRLRDDLASARAVLKKNSMMLLTASKVCEGHRDSYAVLRNMGKSCRHFIILR